MISDGESVIIPSTKSWELSLETVHVMDAESNRLIRQADDRSESVVREVDRKSNV